MKPSLDRRTNWELSRTKHSRNIAKDGQSPSAMIGCELLHDGELPRGFQKALQTDSEASS